MLKSKGEESHIAITEGDFDGDSVTSGEYLVTPLTQTVVTATSSATVGWLVGLLVGFPVG